MLTFESDFIGFFNIDKALIDDVTGQEFILIPEEVFNGIFCIEFGDFEEQRDISAE